MELGVFFEGYKAKIDSIDLKTQYTLTPQPVVIEKKRGWRQFVGIGIGAGYGASVVGNTVHAAPEMGVHITYGSGLTLTLSQAVYDAVIEGSDPICDEIKGIIEDKGWKVQDTNNNIFPTT